MVPEDLASEYRFIKSLDDANAVRLVESVATGGQYVLKLLNRSSLSDDRFPQQLQLRSQIAGNRLNTPARTGSIADGRYFTLTDYRPEGSLYSCFTGGTPLPREAIRPLIRDLATACRQMHDEREGFRIIHGDIKPSNVLIVRRGSQEADWEFRLSDFDSAILLDSNGPPIVPGLHTAGYAAPEVLRPGTSPDISMDYWAMGMLLFTCLLGQHPFGDLPDEQVSALLVDQEWQPSGSISQQVEDEACRALLGGLLLRVPDERWGATEVQQWLADEPNIVARGLRLLGENAADAPFSIDGDPAYTAGNVAIALLRSWNTEILRSDALAHWLSPTAANHVARLQGMDADAALLDFCGTYYPGERMPPFWQREEVSAANFASLADRANSGDASARTCLLTFLNHGHHYFVSRPESEYGDVADLVDSITQARDEYREAWQTIANAGGPSSMPSEEDCWIHATLIACSPVNPRAQLQELFDPLLIMRRADWFLAFGTDPARINQSQLFVLRSLQEASLLEHVNISHIDRLGNVDAPGLWEDVVLPVSQRRLLGSLAVRPEARIDNVAAGETYPPNREPSIADHIAAALHRGFHWCAARLRRQREETRQPQNNSRFEMRIVRLTIRAGQKPVSEEEEDELYLAMISWSGAGPHTRLVVANPAIFPIRRFQAPVPAEGRMLLVIERNAQIYLAGSGLGFWRDPNRSIRILMSRKYPVPLRRLVQPIIPRLPPLRRIPSISSIQVSQRIETDLGGKKLHTVRPDILCRADQQALQRAGVLRRAIGPTDHIGVTTQQREDARRYCAVSNIDWPTSAPYTQKTRLNSFRRALRRIFQRPPRQQ